MWLYKTIDLCTCKQFPFNQILKKMTTSNRNLTITVVDGTSANVRVRYTVTFTPFERQLANLGMRFREEISVIGSDIGEVLVPPGGTPPPLQVLGNFANQILPVTNGNVNQVINRDRSIPVTRAALQEDPGPNPDEIQARITIRPLGFPGIDTSFTDIETLLG